MLVLAPPLQQSTGFRPCARSLSISTSNYRGRKTMRCPLYSIISLSQLSLSVSSSRRIWHCCLFCAVPLGEFLLPARPSSTTRPGFSRSWCGIQSGSCHRRRKNTLTPPGRSSLHLPLRGFECQTCWLPDFSSHPNYTLPMRNALALKTKPIRIHPFLLCATDSN